MIMIVSIFAMLLFTEIDKKKLIGYSLVAVVVMFTAA
jgi:hypothetical protein